MVLLFDRLLSAVIDWENVAVSASKNCIVFVHNLTFLIIRPMKKQLDLKFYTETEQTEGPIIKSVFYAGKFENHIRISTLEELTPNVFNYIKQSYELL